MAVKAYTATDYAACRWILENWSSGASAVIGLPLTTAMVDRLALLNLVDGPITGWSNGDLVRLSGLGRKTAAEAIRLGIAAITAGVLGGGQSRPNPTQQHDPNKGDDCP